MTDGEALMAAILAHPHDDNARLVYADWLDERGDSPRAELIRVQIELSRLAGPLPLELVTREKTLIHHHSAEWLKPLRARGEALQSSSTHGQFRRGFVEVVWMPAALFVAKFEKLFRREPTRELRVTRTVAAELAQLVGCAGFRQLEGLDLSDRRLGAWIVELLTQQGTAAGLRILRLRGCALSTESALRLADADFDWPLRELDVSHNAIDPAGIAALRKRFGDALRTGSAS